MNSELKSLPFEQLKDVMFALIRRHATTRAIHDHLLSQLEELIGTAQMILLDDLTLQQSVDSTKKPHKDARQRLLKLRYSPETLAANDADMKHLANWVLAIASEQIKAVPGNVTLDDAIDRVAEADQISVGASVDMGAFTAIGLQPDEALELKEKAELLKLALKEVNQYGTEGERAAVAARETDSEAEVETFAALANISEAAVYAELEKQNSMNAAALRQRICRARQQWLARLAGSIAAVLCFVALTATDVHASSGQTSKASSIVLERSGSGQTSPPGNTETTLQFCRSGQT